MQFYQNGFWFLIGGGSDRLSHGLLNPPFMFSSKLVAIPSIKTRLLKTKLARSDGENKIGIGSEENIGRVL